MFATVRFFRNHEVMFFSFIIFLKKNKGFKAVKNGNVCMYVCVYVCIGVCVYVNKILSSPLDVS